MPRARLRSWIACVFPSRGPEECCRVAGERLPVNNRKNTGTGSSVSQARGPLGTFLKVGVLSVCGDALPPMSPRLSPVLHACDGAFSCVTATEKMSAFQFTGGSVDAGN